MLLATLSSGWTLNTSLLRWNAQPVQHVEPTATCGRDSSGHATSSPNAHSESREFGRATLLQRSWPLGVRLSLTCGATRSLTRWLAERRREWTYWAKQLRFKRSMAWRGRSGHASPMQTWQQLPISRSVSSCRRVLRTTEKTTQQRKADVLSAIAAMGHDIKRKWRDEGFFHCDKCGKGGNLSKWNTCPNDLLCNTGQT